MHLRYFSIFMLLFTAISLLSLEAQNYINVLNGRYYYLPSATLKENDQSIRFNEFRIKTALPMELKGGNVVGIKPQYKTFSLRSDVATLKDLKLHTFKLPIFTFLNFGESGWSVYLDISPKLNSDLKNITNKHFQIGGMFIFFKERNEDFFWQFGMFYNQDTYGPFFMPLFGFDWKRPLDAMEKVREELDELEKALLADNKEEAGEEIGDLLFSLANVSRHLGVNPEIALRKTNDKFSKRFRYIEERLKEQGAQMEKVSLDELDDLWQEAKETFDPRKD